MDPAVLDSTKNHTSSVANPKLLISNPDHTCRRVIMDPDLDPIWRVISDPDPTLQVV